jgi:hypothetical protein
MDAEQKTEAEETQGAEGDERPAESRPQEGSETSGTPEEELEKLTGKEEAEESEAGEVEESEASEEPEAEEGKEAEDSDKPRAGRRDEKIEKRISELTAARKTAEERASAAETRAKELETKAGANLGLHPDYLKPEEAELIARANELEAREEFLLRHWDGYEDEKDEKRSLTANQVREEYVQVRRDARSVVAKANEVYEERKRQQMADMQEGRRIRLEREKARLRQAPKAPGKTIGKVPPAPIAGKTSAPPVMETNNRKRGVNEKRFVEAGATREAAARELAELVGE